MAHDENKSRVKTSLMNYNVTLYFFLINGRHLLRVKALNCFVSPPFVPHRPLLCAFGFPSPSSFLSGRFDSATNDPLATIIPGVAEKLKRTNGTAGGRLKRQCSWLPLNSSCSRSIRIHGPPVSTIDVHSHLTKVYEYLSRNIFFFYKYTCRIYYVEYCCDFVTS